MKLLLSINEHYFRTVGGSVYTEGPHRFEFLSRYLQIFEEVVVLARTQPVGQSKGDWARVNGERVSVIDLPDYVGPHAYLARRRKLYSVTNHAVDMADAYLLRSGGDSLAMMAWQAIRRRRRPYGLEVTTDPWDALAPGTHKSRLRPIGRWVYTRNLRRMCRCAAAVAYVTRETLQFRYPPSPRAFVTYYSSVEMPDEAYAPHPRRFTTRGQRLVYVGGLQNFDKGIDLLIEAVAGCVKRQVPVYARVLGDGKRRTDAEKLIRARGVTANIELLGMVADRTCVRQELDRADLFVLPSRVEGLPRAMIEAMGRGLPCVGSHIGGIPELLPATDTVPPRDAVALCDRIVEILGDPERMTRMSARNLRVARDYRSDVLQSRRVALYQQLRSVSET